MMNEEVEGREVATADTGTIEKISRGEADVMFERAHKHPRNVKHFRAEVETLACLTQEVAEECYYALTRKDKNGDTVTIEGPSARFAEIVAYCWGNNSAGARVVDDRGDFVVAQGVFQDVERTTRIVYEVQRRITTSRGTRYGADMIGVTSNAACSIALRNAILKGVPKAFWNDLYLKAKQVAVGDVTTLVKRRLAAVKKFASYGVSEAQILAKLNRPSIDQVTTDDLGLLLGLHNAIKEGDTTAEQAFAADAPPIGDMMPKPKTEGSTGAAATVDSSEAQASTGGAAAPTSTAAPAATSATPNATGTSPSAGNGAAAAAGAPAVEAIVFASPAQQKAIKDMVLKRYEGDLEAFDAFHERYMHHFCHSLDKTPAASIAAAITWTAAARGATVTTGSGLVLALVFLLALGWVLDWLPQQTAERLMLGGFIVIVGGAALWLLLS
jgi:hypothetical protein